MKVRPSNEFDRILEEPEYDVIRDVADQIDLLAYLVAKAADPGADGEQRPHPVDLHLPHAGLHSLLLSWSDQLISALEVTDQTIPIHPGRPIRKVRS